MKTTNLELKETIDINKIETFRMPLCAKCKYFKLIYLNKEFSESRYKPICEKHETPKNKYSLDCKKFTLKKDD